MIIKKYLAKTEKEAIEMAKEDLGSNAIVMNIKKVHPKGLAKIFMRSKVEVTAALDDNPAASATTSAATSPAPSQTVSHVDIEIPKEVPEQTESEQSIQNKLMKLQLLLEKQMQQKDTELEKTAESKKTENVVKQQEETKETNDEKENAEKTGDKSSAYKELIYQQLIQNEVDSDIANSIMDEVSRSLPADAALDQILASVYQKIILMMGQPYVIKPDRKDKTQYIFFLGSTGVGKTTKIAKIACKVKL